MAVSRFCKPAVVRNTTPLPTPSRAAGAKALKALLTGLCALVGLLALALWPVAAQSPVASLLLDDSYPQVQVWPAVKVLADPGKALGLDDVRRRVGEFQSPKTAYGTLGLREDAVWLHVPFSLSDKSAGFWVLDVDYAVLNRIDIHLVSDGKLIESARLGNLLPFDQRLVGGRAHSFGFGAKPGTSYELFMRVENSGSMILPITLNRPAAFLTRALAEQMLQGLLTGLALCLLIYSLAQWASLGESLFAKYALLISGSLLFSLLQFGVGAQYIWSGNVWMELHMGGLSALIAATGSFLFIEGALAGPDMPRWMSSLMKGGAALTALSALCYALDWLTVYQVTAIVSTLGLAPALLGLPGAIHRARRGDSVGIYFLLAWAVYFVTTAILIEVIKGRVGVNFWTLHSFQFGATFDMLLFMRVLGLRTKALKAAVQTATIERDTFHSLAHTDPLTGLPNRRSLDQSINAAIQGAGPEKLMAIYMLDLDGFKGVNDQHGHDVGDELLIAVAKRLQDCLRATDLITRLGGDEFLVVSSGLKSPQQAQELGDKLLKSFSEDFVLSSQTCRVGMTIGYALAPTDSKDTRELLKLADAAMYAGKQSGKNCVKRGDSIGILSSSPRQ
ncbi:MAG: diguanylate cyclase domain-containing protein [Rhodoferax sp.]